MPYEPNLLCNQNQPMEALLTLRERKSKPRQDSGLTSALDNGISLRELEDLIESSGDHIDFIKFGWGSAILTRNLEKKIDHLKRNNIDFWFGGTLFEIAHAQGCVKRICNWAHALGASHFEISDGTIDLPREQKLEYIGKISQEFRVLSEVGDKDPRKMKESECWIREMKEELTAGA